ncbi:glutamine-hydrolyzing GMP synthase [Sporolactobacillus spathodeae]|uniref:GMP synthase [glutamine-hydrolyzing] n=1 Tax=Sporolactobacillus spathodeae TaxID=1465502 RepID=A0ABS2Q9F9_9BACL|nr:glutamine-hydrolyzing GMP synthase [Sporolactobacillus spathodeae]MBM7658417.1 GMP synthase (glutamine-hydrolyzing) [Sporolactobacillus spathodeae]
MGQPNNLIIVMDFGGQYNQLIARRIRDLGVYSELMPNTLTAAQIKEKQPKGIIFSGGPNSVYGEGAPKCDPDIFELGIPVLGICYGMQLMSVHFGADVARASHREYGKADISADTTSTLFAGLPAEQNVWMSHGDLVKTPPAGFKVEARSESCPVAAMSDAAKKLYGVQFHPEVRHTKYGIELLSNFIFKICGAEKSWSMEHFIDEQVEKIRAQVGNGQVLCALSGGVDSSVAAALVHKAIGDQLTCVFVNHGLLRKGEAEGVVETFKNRFHMNFVYVDASKRFLDKLEGISDPERKRKIIGNEFIYLFEEEAQKLSDIDWLVQGTLYTDVVESGAGGSSQTIKSHHNVGGLPEDMTFKLIEPLNTLFKDEVRKLGSELGLADDIVWRQPFPGPGLGIRVLGAIDEEKLAIVRESDAILREEVKNAGLERDIWQYFTVLPNIQSVGVMGDGRTYDHCIAIRAVTSIDGMTSDWARIPWDVLEKISTRIVNEVEHVNRIVYDITSKPPATIEWE